MLVATMVQMGNTPFLALAAFIAYISFTVITSRSVDGCRVKEWDLLSCDKDLSCDKENAQV